jgi:hypothetical protein
MRVNAEQKPTIENGVTEDRNKKGVLLRKAAPLNDGGNPYRYF